MCAVMEELRNEALAQGVAQGMAKAYMDMGMPLEDIAEKPCITEDDVKEIIQRLEENEEQGKIIKHLKDSEFYPLKNATLRHCISGDRKAMNA